MVTVALHPQAVTVVCGICADERTFTGPDCLHTATYWASAHRQPQVRYATLAYPDGSPAGIWTP